MEGPARASEMARFLFSHLSTFLPPAHAILRATWLNKQEGEGKRTFCRSAALRDMVREARRKELSKEREERAKGERKGERLELVRSEGEPAEALALAQGRRPRAHSRED